MEVSGQKLSQIEEVLYRKETAKIDAALKEIGRQLEELFSPYYKDGADGEFSEDFSELIKQSAFASSGYCAGYHTHAELRIWAGRIPEKMKAAILKKICADFVETVGEVEEVCSQIEL